MKILIRHSPEDVATTAAQIFAQHITPGARIGLATGSTPLLMYQELIRKFQRGDLTFAQVDAFLLDEYVGLPKEHRESYYATIRREFTEHIDIADTAVHSPDGTHTHPCQAARQYQELIDAAPIDIQLLGIGANGHLGFNEPTSALTSVTRVKTLHPKTVQDNARFFDSAQDVPHHVITQGLGTIQKASHLLLLATGEAKVEAVKAMVEGPLSAFCPASVLQLHPQATVVLDQAAAAALSDKDYYRFVEEHQHLVS